jgi:hypothetical protein
MLTQRKVHGNSGGGDPRPGLPAPPSGDLPTPSSRHFNQAPPPPMGDPPTPLHMTRLYSGSSADGMYRDPLIRSLLVEIWPLCCNQIILYNDALLFIATRQLGTGMSPAGCCEQLENTKSNLS